MAHAPSTASSNPGRRHTELLLIQPLLNNVSPSAETGTEICGGGVLNITAGGGRLWSRPRVSDWSFSSWRCD